MKRNQTLLTLSVVLAAGTARADVPAFKCLAAKIKKVEVGRKGNYDAKEGLTSKSYGGFLERSEVKPSKQCLIPDVLPGQSVVLWYDKKSYDAATKGANMFPGMQCIFIDDGKELGLDDEPATNTVAEKDVLTRCPNETGYECDAGSNSDRNSKYRETLNKQGLVMQSFSVRPNDNMSSAAAR